MHMTRKARGFTLIELVIVIMLTGIVIAAVSMRMPGDGINLGAQAEQLASDIRYTQSLAMSRGARFRINFTAGTYQITDAAGVAQGHPSTGLTTPVSLGTTVLSAYNPPLTNSYLAFDSLGVPYTDPTTALAALVTLTLTSGGVVINITVAPQTGRVKLL